MGQKTDAHIIGVTDALQKLQISMRRVDTTHVAMDDAWSKMMTAYDKGGKTASTAASGPVVTAAKNYDDAVTATKNHAAVATKAMNDFSKFVTDKDKGTWNPLAKKSIGKAKKFITAQKPIVDGLVAQVNGTTSMVATINSVKGIYF